MIAVVQNNKIKHLIETDDFSKLPNLFPNHQFFEVPNHFDGRTDEDIRQFDHLFHRKNDEYIMQEKLINFDENIETIENHRVRLMTDFELYQKGKLSLEWNQYADTINKTIVSVSDPEEQLERSMITQEQYDIIKWTPVRQERDQKLNECDTIYCNAEKWEWYSQEQRARWRAYKQALRDIPQTQQDPNNIQWPIKPI